MRKINFLTRIISVTNILIVLTACSRDSAEPDTRGYPLEVRDLIINNCTNAGCHNDKSKEAAGELSLTLWNNLFESTDGNASIIPYRADQSYLMYFINTYDELGTQLTPTMPYNSAPFSKEEVITIRDWINSGAPDVNGFVKFSENPNRKKLYVINQGCDIASVFDVETQLIMRYVDVGSTVSAESPHMVRVSNDGKYWYVCFYSGNMFQKFSALNDTLISQIDIGFGQWNTFTISSDSKKCFVVDWSANGQLAYIDLDNMTLITKYQGAGLFEWPHGSSFSPDNNYLYVTAQYGNFIYKINITDPLDPQFEKVVLDTTKIPSTTSKYDPHEICFTPDGMKCFVTCQKSNEVRVFNTYNDSLIKTISIGVFPQELDFSSSTDYLFVTCSEDNQSFPGKIGSVAIIDYNKMELIKLIYTGYQPHGLAVDDENYKVYVANRNVSSDGPASHHTSACGSKNGYITIIDIKTLELVDDYNAEVSVDPYSVALKK